MGSRGSLLIDVFISSTWRKRGTAMGDGG